MAFFGALDTMRVRCGGFPGMKPALAYAEQAITPGTPVHAQILGLAEGASRRLELTSGAYAIEMIYRTKSRPEGFFETHRKYVDLQVIVTGEELMEVAAAAQLDITQAYDEAKDLIKYADSDAASVLRMRAGDAAVFWPEDAHMPSLAIKTPALVRKTVIKVPVF